MTDQILERVRQFVAEQRSVPLARVQPSTTLFGDLGIDGDDADDLFLAFEKEFSVDLSDLDLNRHFGPEGLYPWAPFYWLILAFRKGSPEERTRLEPITVADLARAAAAGRWSYSTMV